MRAGGASRFRDSGATLSQRAKMIDVIIVIITPPLHDVIVMGRRRVNYHDDEITRHVKRHFVIVGAFMEARPFQGRPSAKGFASVRFGPSQRLPLKMGRHMRMYRVLALEGAIFVSKVDK